jgi:hypothetical protein
MWQEVFSNIDDHGQWTPFGISQGHKLVRPFKGIILYPNIFWGNDHDNAPYIHE